jgi:hypothetical protein
MSPGVAEGVCRVRRSEGSVWQGAAGSPVPVAPGRSVADAGARGPSAAGTDSEAYFFQVNLFLQARELALECVAVKSLFP